MEPNSKTIKSHSNKIITSLNKMQQVHMKNYHNDHYYYLFIVTTFEKKNKLTKHSTQTHIWESRVPRLSKLPHTPLPDYHNLNICTDI